MKKLWLVTLVAAGALAMPAQAEVQELRIAQQFGIGYMPLAVMKGQGLIEKHAQRLGLPAMRIVWSSFAGGSNMNDALLSRSLDVATGGVPPLITLWSRTEGPNKVRIASVISEMPLLLNTTDPAVRSIKDFTDKHKIALPAVRTSNQAVLLSMAAEKIGPAEAERLGRLTVSMSHPDATVALLNGNIAAHFSSPPYQYRQLQDARVRTVLNSSDVIGPFTFTVAWTTERFRQENPKTYEAFVSALAEAIESIRSNRRAAAETYVRETGSKESAVEIEKMIALPGVQFTTTPRSVQRYAEYMHRLGLVKVKPAKWQDLFFENVHGAPGS